MSAIGWRTCIIMAVLSHVPIRVIHCEVPVTLVYREGDRRKENIVEGS